MNDKLFTDVTLQISSSYTYKRILYNDYISNWSKPHIYEKVIDGERYTIIQDNSRELQSFMYNLTDYSRLKKYSSFSWIDDNTGKKEKVDDKEIGSSAGYLARIKATDYLSYLEEIKL